MKFNILPPSNVRNATSGTCSVCEKKLKQYKYYRIDKLQTNVEIKLNFTMLTERGALVCSQECINTWILQEM